MGLRSLLALFLALLVLGHEAQGSFLDRPELAQVQESLSMYWDSARAAAQDLYEKTYLTSVDEKLRDMYSKGTAAITTYASIFTDQLLTMLKGE